ncbi:hypothetical protein MBLNU230_g2413t1 [Neophaeotheca triangularis]
MVNQKAQDAVQKSLDSVTGDPSTGIPGLVFVAIDKNGDEVASHASGKRGLDTDKPMDFDTVFWIASCTKLLATIACLQAVEDGKLNLDDSKQVYQLCPELDKMKVLKEDGSFEDKKEDITLRMLLSHTAGFGYEFFNPKLLAHGRPIGHDVFSGDPNDIYNSPLVNQPGERWEYGTNIDWASLCLERATNIRLNDWIQTRICQPLNLQSTNMFPTAPMKANLAHMQQRWPSDPTNRTHTRDHPLGRPLRAQTAEEKASTLHSGGAGCFSRPRDYVQVLACLLNSGSHPQTRTRILKPETVTAMFQNQIPDSPDFARQPTPAAKPEYTNPLPELYPQEGNPPQGWGLSFMLTPEPCATGRGPGSGYWAGIANLFWWVDPAKGVAGMIASQVLPFGDPHVMGQWAACEAAVYAAL